MTRIGTEQQGTQTASSSAPIPGGRWTVPTGGVNRDGLVRLAAQAGVPEGDRDAWVGALLTKNAMSLQRGGVIVQNGQALRAGASVQLPPLSELRASQAVRADVAPVSPSTTTAVPPMLRREGAPADAVPPMLRRPDGAGVSLRGQAPATRTEAPVRQAPVSAPVDPKVEAARIGTAFRTGDLEKLYDALHGKTKQEQRAIIDAFNRSPAGRPIQVAVVPEEVAGLGARFLQEAVGITRTQAMDFDSQVSRLGASPRAQVAAYRRNPESRLEPHDRIYLSLKGVGTYEEGIYHPLENMTRAEIETAGKAYKSIYKQDLLAAIDGDMDGVDFEKAKMLLRGKDQLTPEHRKAFDLYRFGAGQWGTSDVPIFQLLEGERGEDVKRIAGAYKELFNTELFGALDGEFDGTWFKRMEAAYAGNDAPKETRAKYVAHTAQLFLMGDVDWNEMSRVLSHTIDPTGQNGPTIADTERIFADGRKNVDMTDLMKTRATAEQRSLIEVLERGGDPKTSPEALAIAVYHQTIGTWGTGEEEVCKLLADAPPSVRRDAATAFNKMYKQSLEAAITSDFADTPAWQARALAHLRGGRLGAEEMLRFFAMGAGTGTEVVSAVGELAPSARASFAQRYDQANGTNAFETAVKKLTDREQRAVRDQLAVGGLATGDLEQMKQRVQAQLGRERGTSGWDAVSHTLMDRFGWTGRFVNEDARNLFNAVEAAQKDGTFDQQDLDKVVGAYREFLHSVKEYQKEKDSVGETAGDIAAASAALIVSVASGGSAAPLVVAIAAGASATAKVAAEKAFKGGDYQLGSVEFFKDLAVGGVDGAVTVATAGLSKSAQGARFGTAVLIEANAAGLGGAASGFTRRLVDERTYTEPGGAKNLFTGLFTDYAFSFGTGAVTSAAIRGTGALYQKYRLTRAQSEAGRQLGKGGISADVVTDTHGAAADGSMHLADRQGRTLRHVGDVIDKGSQQGPAGNGTRGVIAELRAAETQSGGKVLVNAGNHEEVLFATLDNPTRYANTAQAELNRDVALRRLLGKPSTNLSGSVLAGYGITGEAKLGQAARVGLADRIEQALANPAAKLGPDKAKELRSLATALRDPKAPPAGFLKAAEKLDGELATLVQGQALNRRDVVRLHSVLSAANDAEIGAKELYLVFADAGGNMSLARDQMQRLSTTAGIAPEAMAKQVAGFDAMSKDLGWLRSRMVAFQIDPSSGSLMLHAGVPFEVAPDGKTILRPDKIVEAQRMVEQGRWLELSNPENFNLNPAWGGEASTVNPHTGGLRDKPATREFSFRRPDVTPKSYEDALAKFNAQLREDPTLLAKLGVEGQDAQRFFDRGGVRMLATGHENVRTDWINQRAAKLRAENPALKVEDAMAKARGEWGTVVGEAGMADAMAQEFDRRGGLWQPMDFGLESGKYGTRQSGGRFQFNEDGTFRVRKTTSTVEGLQLTKEAPAEVVAAFKSERVTLGAAGAIELPRDLRQRVSGELMASLGTQFGDAEVTRVLDRLMPGVPKGEAMERFAVDFYRMAGKSEGKVLDALTTAMPGRRLNQAIELATPAQAFKALAEMSDDALRAAATGADNLERALGGSVRTATRGIVECPAGMAPRDFLSQTRDTLLRNHPGSRVIEDTALGVMVELNMNGVTSNVLLQGDGRTAWITIGMAPLTGGRNRRGR